jgi:hypothetical protein
VPPRPRDSDDPEGGVQGQGEKKSEKEREEGKKEKIQSVGVSLRKIIDTAFFPTPSLVVVQWLYLNICVHRVRFSLNVER